MIEDKLHQYIRSVKVNTPIDKEKEYPFSLDTVKDLNILEFDKNVSFIVGENASGKSTLLEGIAEAYGFNAEGGGKNFSFATSKTNSILSDHLIMSKGVKRPKDGFFLRAESFYNVATNIDNLDMGGMSPKLINSYGGKSLHKQSHGESFLSLVLNRFRGKGLYILDEPEAALSPSRQMALICKIHELVKDDSQFIIATHSPILMSYPNSTIYNIEDGYKKITLEETEHYQITKKFMVDRDSILKKLL